MVAFAKPVSARGAFDGRHSMSLTQAAMVSVRASRGSVPSAAQNRRWSSTARPYASIVLEA